MKIVRSPIGRSAAIVTLICAIAIGNLATSSGGCGFRSCWSRTTWYVANHTAQRFVVFPMATAYCAWCSSCSGLVISNPGSTHLDCGCVVNGCVCPDHLCCTTVPNAVGCSPLGAFIENLHACKVPR